VLLVLGLLCPRQDSNLRTHLRRTVERDVMATIARITSNQWPISLSVRCGRHDFIPQTIPRERRPLGVPEDSRLRSLRDGGVDARLPQSCVHRRGVRSAR
jgi:hypothetical protein